MSTKVYGASDDLVEFEGDLNGEVNFFNNDHEAEDIGLLVAFSDGTILLVSYGADVS